MGFFRITSLFFGNQLGKLINYSTNFKRIGLPIKYSLIRALTKTQFFYFKKPFKGKLSSSPLSEKTFWRLQKIGVKEPYLTNLILGLNQEDIFWDIGANIGQFTMLAGLKTKAKVFSFEIDPFNYAMLVDNINKNNFYKRCIAFPFGLSSSNKLQEISIYPDSINQIGRSYVYDKSDQIRSHNYPIPVFKGDDIINLLQIDYPSFIKIDVDGPELSILKGMEKILSHKALKNLVVECILEGEGQNLDPIANFLEKFNFQIINKKDNISAKVYNVHFKKSF